MLYLIAAFILGVGVLFLLGVDVSVTATSVVPVAGANIERGTAGAALTAGQTLYIDTSDSNKLKLFDADGSGTDIKTLAGIALHAASSGQPISYLTGGDCTFNAGLTAGVVYVGSHTAGGIMPSADLETGDTVSVLGVATSTTNLRVKIHNSGAVV